MKISHSIQKLQVFIILALSMSLSAQNAPAYWNLKPKLYIQFESNLNSTFKSTQNRFIYNFDARNNAQIGDIYYDSLAIDRFSNKIKNKLSLGGGLNFEQKLSKKINLQYGVGFQFQSFDFSSTTITSEVFPYQKFTVISGSNVSNTSSELVYSGDVDFGFTITDFLSDINGMNLYFLQLPLSVEIIPLKTWGFSAGINYKHVLAARLKGKQFFIDLPPADKKIPGKDRFNDQLFGTMAIRKSLDEMTSIVLQYNHSFSNFFMKRSGSFFVNGTEFNNLKDVQFKSISITLESYLYTKKNKSIKIEN